MGFSGIHKLEKEVGKKVKLKTVREYQAIIFEIEVLDEDVIKFVRKELPDGFELPIFRNGECCILSKKGLVRCAFDDKRFKELMVDAHLEIVRGEMIKTTVKMSLVEVNQLCNDFAVSEQIPVAFIEFDIEKLKVKMEVEEQFESQLERTLVDIKALWFAMDYDFVQCARNTGERPKARFKRYMYINNAIVRIRALGEKLITLSILLERPQDLDRILSSKRVKRMFLREFKDPHHEIVKEIWDYIHSLEDFEERFRTPELHKFGRTIQWAARRKLDGNEVNRLLGHRNDLNSLLRKIHAWFNNA